MEIHSIWRGFWKRVGTVLSPRTAGDNITTTGSIGIGKEAQAGNKLEVVGGDIVLREDDDTYYAIRLQATDSAGTLSIQAAGANVIVLNGALGLGTFNGGVRINGDDDKVEFGANQDAYILFDGNSLNIVANAVTGTDDLEVTANLMNLGATPITTTTTGTFGEIVDNGLAAAAGLVYSTAGKQLTSTPSGGAIGYWTHAGTLLSAVTLTDSFVVGSSSLVDIGATGDARMLFDKTNYAFCAGKVTGAQWDSLANGSIGLGENVTPSGKNSVAIGYGSNASGVQTVAIGYNNDVQDHVNSIALGNGITVQEENAIVIGSGITTNKPNSVVIGVSAPDLQIDADNLYWNGVARLGTTASHYTAISSAGQLTLVGNARVWREHWIDAGAIKAPGAKPALAIAHGALETPAWQFADMGAGNEETISFNLKVPTDMDRMYNLYVCVGWSTTTVDPGDDSKKVEWQLEYLWTGPGEDTTGAAQETLPVTTSAHTVAEGLVTSTFTGINVPSSSDVCMHCRITRLSNGANDTVADDVELHGIVFQYLSNKLGTAF